MNRISTQEELTPAVASGKTAVYVHATWCPFCKVFKPTFEKIAAATPGLTPIDLLIDDEENPIWETYEIQTIPTVLFFVDGALKGRLDAAPAVGLSEKDLWKHLADFATSAA